MTINRSLRQFFAATAVLVAIAAGTRILLRPSAPREQARQTSAASTSRAALDEVITATRRRVAADPGDGEAAVRLADALMRAARVQADASLPLEAERVLRTTLKHAEDYTARRMLAAVYLSQHRFAEGLDVARQLQVSHPEDAWNYAVAGDALLELGRYDEAFDMFDRAVGHRPDAGAYARVAYAKELRGDLAGALDVMRMSAEATAPQDLEAQAWVHTQLGLLRLQLGGLDDAEREFARADFLFPHHPYALNGRIKLALARGRYEEALRLNEQAPRTPESLAVRGDLQARLGNRSAAEAAYVEAERLERDGWKSEQPQPGALARFLAERDRNIPEAVQLAERAAAERADINTMDALAWSYFKAGRLKDAAVAIERALRTGTLDPRIRCHAAVIADARRTGTIHRCDLLNPAKA
jgi:tetratricopeptide (TPR) repeat protein